VIGGRQARLALLLAVAIAGAPPAGAHDAPQVDDEFIKGVFNPSFVPPPPGSYELPVVGQGRRRQLHLHGLLRPSGLSARQRGAARAADPAAG
jgi:hypothetical protein